MKTLLNYFKERRARKEEQRNRELLKWCIEQIDAGLTWEHKITRAQQLYDWVLNQEPSADESSCIKNQKCPILSEQGELVVNDIILTMRQRSPNLARSKEESC